MKSIKPGRGPSIMGVIGGIIAVIFGVFWTVLNIIAKTPFMFSVFGIIFIIAAIVNIVYNYKNATGKNRMSLYDITDADEEPDPIDKYFRYDKTEMEHSSSLNDADEYDRYCPYCGRYLKRDYEYCPKCGKKIED